MGKIADIKLNFDLNALAERFEARKAAYEEFHHKLVGELLVNMNEFEDFITKIILAHPNLIEEEYNALKNKEQLYKMDLFDTKRKILNNILKLHQNKLSPENKEFYTNVFERLITHRNFCAHSRINHPYGQQQLSPDSSEEFTEILLIKPSVKGKAKELKYTKEMHKLNINHIVALMTILWHVK